MKKIIVWLLVIFAIFGGALLIIANVNPNLFREIKLLIGLVVSGIFAVLIIILAVFEKKVARFPFLYAVLSALIAGLVDGILVFKNRYYIGLTVILFIAFVIYLQLRHQKFTNDTKAENSDISDTTHDFENLEQDLEYSLNVAKNNGSFTFNPNIKTCTLYII